jgi:hypothetical protein
MARISLKICAKEVGMLCRQFLRACGVDHRGPHFLLGRRGPEHELFASLHRQKSGSHMIVNDRKKQNKQNTLLACFLGSALARSSARRTRSS